jgi:hypothetical protein
MLHNKTYWYIKVNEGEYRLNFDEEDMNILKEKCEYWISCIYGEVCSDMAKMAFMMKYEPKSILDKKILYSHYNIEAIKKLVNPKLILK